MKTLQIFDVVEKIIVEEGDMGNRKCFSGANCKIVSDCVCDFRGAVGRSTESHFCRIKGLQPVWVTVYGLTPSTAGKI